MLDFDMCREIVDKMNEAFALHKIVLDHKGKPVDFEYIAINPAFERITGYKEKDILGKSITRIMPEIKGEATDWIGKYGKVAVFGQPDHFESYFKNLDKWFSVSVYSPKKYYFVSLFTDISTQKKIEKELELSEERFKSMIEHTRDLFYRHNLSNVLDYVSPQCKRVLGYSQKELMRNWTDLLTDNPMNQRGIVLTERAIETGERQPVYRLEVRRKDGRVILVEIDEAPLKDENGKVCAIVGVLRDITKRIKDEDQLRRKNKELQLINDVAIGRELKMVELKKRIVELEEKLKKFNAKKK